MAPRWFATQDIPYDSMWEDDKFWLPHLLDGEQFTGRFVFNTHDMVEHLLTTAKASSAVGEEADEERYRWMVRSADEELR